MSRRHTADEEFTEFAAARSTQLFRTAYLLVGTPEGAEDLTQTALTKAYVAWPRVRAADDPVAYVHGVLLKVFLSERRRRSSREVPTGHVHADRTVDEDPTDRVALLTALGRLSRKDRAVVVLRYWEDQSVDGTAVLLGLSASAVKNRSLRALRQLRHEMTVTEPLVEDPRRPR